MKILARLALAVALSSPAVAGDLVVTKEKHTDAGTMMGQAQPAQDSVEVIWIGKDRLRVEEGNSVTIVRSDLKKMYQLDTQAKTYTAIDLPIDLKKYVPTEMAPMIEQMASQMKVTVTPTSEIKKIKDWDATRYTLSMSMPMGGGSTQEMWVVKGLDADRAGWQEMYCTLLGTTPFGSAMATEMRKIDGLPVLTERTQSMMGSEIKSRESVVSVEQKEPAADLYDLPKGYTEKPFDPMADMQRGTPRNMPRRK